MLATARTRFLKSEMRFIAILGTAGLLTLAVATPSIAQTAIGAARKPTTHGERKFPISDSRTYARSFGGSDPQLFWINNEEVLFLAVHVLPDASGPNKERLNYAVTRWNTRSGEILRVRDFGEDAPRICYYDGHVLYQFRRKDGSLVAYQGKLGEPERSVDSHQYGSLFCRRLNEIPEIPGWMKDREARRLERIGDGFVDFGERQKWMENTRVRLYRYGEMEGAGKELPFGRREITYRFPYYQFKDAYFVASDYWLHPRPKEIPYPVFWLYRDGRVEKIADIPWGPWRSRASFLVFPAQAGLILYSHNARDDQDIAHAGLYLLSKGKVEQVVSGWVLGLAIAPDGCRLAFTYAPNMTRKNNVLRAMNLCAGS
jgi:hypothetical protein